MAGDDVIGSFKRIGVVGTGSMGTMLTLGFGDIGVDVSVWDIEPGNVDQAMKMAKETTSLKGKVEGFHNIHDFIKSLEAAPRKLEDCGVQRTESRDTHFYRNSSYFENLLLYNYRLY